MLIRVGERHRLTFLRHTGALSYAYPGLSHSRWDYTVSILYVVSRLQRLISSSQFSIGGVTFSSAAAALQCCALLTNIGHLPGTYAVEKGVARYLFSVSSKHPLGSILTRTVNDLRARGERDKAQLCSRISSAANELLVEDDYLVLNRILGIVKLISNFFGRHQVSLPLIGDFYAPFVLNNLRGIESRWMEIDEFFDTARRLAYLNHDTTLIDSPVTVALSPLLSSIVDPKGLTEAAIYQSKEILAAFEHTVFEKLYHSPEARKVSSVLSCRVLQKLSNDPNAIDTIFRWIGDHRLGAVTKSRSLNRTIARASHIGSISIRNFLPDLPDSISETEKDITKFLGAAGGNGLEFAVSVQRYAPPDSKYSIEPDHIYIDAFVLGGAKARQVTRLFQWVADKLDTRDADPDDYVMWLERPEINRNYEALLARAIELAWPGINLHRLTPWPLTRLGKFSDRDEGRDEVTLWLTSSDLNDKCTRHIVRRVSTVPRQLVAIRGEINGLAQLRSRLRSYWKKNRTLPRKRFFLITASVVLSGMKHEGTVEREFDGGLLEISARTGAANLYLLETKGRGTAARAANELTSKLRALNLRGTVTKLKNHSAFATISLS